MFEDISDPPRTSNMNLLRFPPWYWDLTDSFEASWNARVWCGWAFLAVAVDAVQNATTDVSLALRDGAALVLLVLAWIFRKPAVAALATAMSPLFLFGGAGHAGPEDTVGWVPIRTLACILFVFGLSATWACVKYWRFRKEEAVSPSTRSENGLKPS